MLDAIVFDIETGPTSTASMFIPTPKPPASIKKPETLAAWERDEKPKLIEAALADAALSPITGRVLVIGALMSDGEPRIFEGIEERVLLESFWRFYDLMGSAQGRVGLQWYGFNCHSFDWPFLLRRSWVNGVPPPTITNSRGYFADHLVDLRQVWSAGERNAMGSLDVLCRLMGIGQKSGDGANFAKLYAEDHDAAIAYLLNDLAMTRALAERLMARRVPVNRNNQDDPLL